MTSNTRTLTRSERLDWLRLQHTENVGPLTFAQLLDRFVSAHAALANLPALAQKGGRRAPIAIPSQRWAERQLSAIERLGATMIALIEPNYPPLLREIADAPPSINVLGHTPLLHRPAIGVVGARNASTLGREMTRRLCHGLGETGYVITSGLARGIDAAAHQATLATGTIAVVAGGLDNIYPRENETLFQDIAANGAIVSEMLVGQKPLAKHFPRRNRIISGLSEGLLVVEATRRSGSMITARLALEQNRQVMAVPGFPLEPRAAGPNWLIKQGAFLIENAEDVLQALARTIDSEMADRTAKTPVTPPPVQPNEDELAAARPHVKEALGFVATSIDDLIESTGLTSAVVLTILLELELAGRLERQPGFRVSLVANTAA